VASHRVSTSEHPCRPAAILPLPHLWRISSPGPSPADLLPLPHLRRISSPAPFLAGRRRARGGDQGAGGGVPAVGVADRWVEVRDNLLFFIFPFFIFNWTDRWVPVHVSTYRTSLALTGGSHLSDSVSIHVQLAISANQKKNPEKSWFFAIKT
jgi:hypothetical protein